MRFEYHDPPVFTVNFDMAPTSDCNDLVLQQNAVTNVTISVHEDYWGEIPSCSWVEGALYSLSPFRRLFVPLFFLSLLTVFFLLFVPFFFASAVLCPVLSWNPIRLVA